MGMFTLLPTPVSVRTPAEARKAVAILSKRFILAVDTETTGLSLLHDRAIILAISDGKDRYTVWPEAIPYFKKLLETPEIKLIMHNAKFDMWMLSNIGINVNKGCRRDYAKVYDTMVMHALLDDSAEHKLKTLSNDFLQIEMIPFNELFGKQMRKRPLHDVLLDSANEQVVSNYASLDAFATYYLFLLFSRWLSEMPITAATSPYSKMWEYYTGTELLYTKVLWEIEMNGMLLDREALQGVAPGLEKRSMELHKWFIKMTGNVAINLNSDNEMADLFFNRLGYSPRTWTAGGAPQLNEPVLSYWAVRDCAYAKRLLEYRDTNKHLNTYVLGLLRLMGKDGRVHGNLRQTGAKTGRLSSADPNLQNQPGYIRNVYVAPGDSRMAAADYAQLEMRVLAHFSDDDTLVRSIKDGLDIHSATAAQMYKVPYEAIIAARKADNAGEELSNDQRRYLKYRKGAKTIGFGLMYGQGARRLSDTLGITVPEAQALMKVYFKALPGVVAYFENAIKQARKDGYCSTLLGRQRQVPGITSTDGALRSSSERQVKNSPIQGTAADITKMAMLNVYRDPLITAAGVRMTAQVHDEIVFEMPKNVENDADVNQRISDVMCHPFDFDLLVPLEIDKKYGDNWAEAK